METALTGATWFWLLVPMPLLIISSFISYVSQFKKKKGA